MRVTPPIAIDSSAKLISSTASDIHAPAAYAADTTYALGALASVSADYAIYESLQSANTGHTPLTSPLWWRQVGATETAWSSATTYALGATASYNQRLYESRQPANTNHAPPVLPETSTAWWLDVGAANKWAMFDLATNTQTVMPPGSALTVVIRPGQRINTIGVLGLAAHSITISATSVFGGGTVYGPLTTNLIIRNVADGYDYAFEPFRLQPSLAYFDVPSYSDIEVTISISTMAGQGNVKCGSIVLGTSVYLGEVEYGARGDALNFSTIDRDLYGNATLVPRRSVSKTNQTLKVSAQRINKIRAARTELNAVPAMYSGLDDGASKWFDMLLLVGVYKQFEIDATHFDTATITLEIEEI